MQTKSLSDKSNLSILFIPSTIERSSLFYKALLLRLQDSATKHTAVDIEYLEHILSKSPDENLRSMAISTLMFSSHPNAKKVLQKALDAYKKQAEERLSNNPEFCDINFALVVQGVKKTTRIFLEINPEPPIYLKLGQSTDIE